MNSNRPLSYEHILHAFKVHFGGDLADISVRRLEDMFAKADAN